jgi:uroporphyrinogen-III synthase
MIVVVTRPEPGNAATCSGLSHAGLTPIAAALFTIRKLAHSLPERLPDAILVSSSNALRCVTAQDVQRLADQPLFAVGETTSEAARAVGFKHVKAGPSDLEALVPLIQSTLPKGSTILRLSARDRNDAGLAKLAEQFNVETVLIYEAVAVETLPARIVALSEGGIPCAVMHFSRRAALTFEALCRKVGLERILGEWMHLCVSEAARLPAFEKAHVAEKPTEAEMLALATSLSGFTTKTR